MQQACPPCLASSACQVLPCVASLGGGGHSGCLGASDAERFILTLQVKVEVARSSDFATLCTVPTRLFCPGLSGPEYWSGWPCPLPGGLPDPGMEPRSPALQADSLPSEPPGKALNAEFPQMSAENICLWSL